MKKFNVYLTCISFALSPIQSYAYDTNQNQNNNGQQNQNTFDPNNNQHVNLNQEVENAKKRTDAENQQYREQQAQQTNQQLQKAEGHADGALNSVNQASQQANSDYSSSPYTTTNANGSAYQQAEDGQKKADNGNMIGTAMGGVLVVAGGVAIAAGVAEKATILGIPPGEATIAVGCILVAMGGMELAQAQMDQDASDQAKRSQASLKGFDPNQRYSYDPKKTNTNSPYNYNTDPNNNGTNSQNNNNTTSNTSSTAKNGDGSQSRNAGDGNGGQTIIPGSEAETKMSNEFAKYGIGYDKKSQTVTLPDGRQFSIQDIQKGKMPDSELQAAYNKASAIGGDIAARELAGNGLGGGLAGSSGAGNSALGFGNKNDSNLSNVAGALKSGLGAGGAGADGAGGRGIASEDGAGADGVSGAGLRGKAAKTAAEQAAAAKALAAKVAGLSTNYNGEPIGVASDSIFEMVKRRYEVKDKENSFINDLITVTSN